MIFVCYSLLNNTSGVTKKAAEVAQKRRSNWPMMSFIHNGREITTWVGYSFKTKSTKSKAKQHFKINIFFESQAADL